MILDDSGAHLFDGDAPLRLHQSSIQLPFDTIPLGRYEWWDDQRM